MWPAFIVPVHLLDLETRCGTSVQDDAHNFVAVHLNLIAGDELQRTGKTYRCYHSEFPTYGSADSEIVLICSHWRLAVKVFINVKTKPEVFNNLYP